MFLCPRCDAERRILHIVPFYQSCGCHGCLPVVYETARASRSPRREAIARFGSLARGRRRPRGGQAAHEDRLRRAEDDAAREVVRQCEVLLMKRWGIEGPGILDEATPAELKAALGWRS